MLDFVIFSIMNQQLQHINIKSTPPLLNIIFNRPKKKNALHPEMIQEIQDTLEKYHNDMNIRTVLISSNSDVFCAGADINYLQKIKNFSYEENLQDSEQLMTLFKTMLLYPKIIISKVTGSAIGGGCGIMTASDIVFATQTAKFGYPEVKIGFIPALVSTFLIKKIGENNARELLLTGEIINVEKAKQIGLINRIVTDNNINQEINNFITNISKNTSMNSVAETKRMIYNWMDFDNQLQQAAKFNAKHRKTDDFNMGINAFLNKTSLNWHNIKK